MSVKIYSFQARIKKIPSGWGVGMGECVCVCEGAGPENVFQVIIVFCKRLHGTLPAGPIAARGGLYQNF